MNLAMILDMVADGMADRVLIGDRDGGLTGADVRAKASAGAQFVASTGADRLVYLGGNGPTFPVALFAATLAGVPFLPLNYRLSPEQMSDVRSRQDNPLVITVPRRPLPVPWSAALGRR